MKEKEERTPTGLEICDPKPPVIHSGRRVAADTSGLTVCGYPTYPDCARFDTQSSHLAQ